MLIIHFSRLSRRKMSLSLKWLMEVNPFRDVFYNKCSHLFVTGTCIFGNEVIEEMYPRWLMIVSIWFKSSITYWCVTRRLSSSVFSNRQKYMACSI